MIKTRARKIIRDVIARKGRTLMVSTAIFIGVIGTIALFSMSSIVVGQLREDIQEDKLYMILVAVEADTSAQLNNAEVLQQLSEFPGVTSVTGGDEDSFVFFKTDPEDEKFEDGVVQSMQVWNGDTENPQLVNVPFEAEAPIEPFRLLTEGERNESEGRWPEPGKNEILVERRMAEEYDVKVGDTVYFRVPSPSRDPQKNGETGTEEAWTVTGIVFDPYAFNPKIAFYTDVSNSNYLSGGTGFTAFLTRFTDFKTAEDSSKEYQDFIAENTPYAPRFAQITNPEQNLLIQNAQLLGNLMGFLALVSLIVSGFLVINVISSLVVEQKRQIGVMKSLGATRQDNFFIYSGIAFAYGLLAVIPGVILGIPAGNAAAHALAPQVNTVLEGFKVSPGSVILGIIVGLLVPVGASLLPVFNGTRVRILEAMTDLGIDARYGTGPLARIIEKLPVPITVRQGLSNISIKKSRLAFTVITLAIAVGTFMGIFAIFATMTSGIQTYIDTFNVQVGIAPIQSVEPGTFEQRLVQTLESEGEEVKSLEPGVTVQIEIEGYDPAASAFGPPGIFVYGYDVTSEDPAFRFTIDEGERLTPETADDGIIISSSLASSMGKTVGDRIVVKLPGNSKELTIVGISEFPVDQAWMDWKAVAEMADFYYDEIEGGSPINSMIPDEARSFIEYASLVNIEGYEQPVTALGISPISASFLTFESGGFFTQENPGIIISQTVAENGGYEVGDEVTLVSQVGDETSRTYQITGIFGAIPMPAGEEGAANSGQMPEDVIGIFWRDLAELDGAQVSSVPRPQIYFLNTPNEDASARDLNDLVDTVNAELAKFGMPVFALNFVELTDQISTAFFTVQAILSAVAGLIALVGALGLLTTLSMSVFERQKEIGVMRSIGASSWTVATQFLTEGIVVGVLAWIIGLFVMVGIQYGLLQIIGADLFPLEISPTAVVVGLVGILLITIVASLGPSISASRKTVSDILRYQ